ncbi:MFS transporter [Roseomonas sp. NAR14]|uniref:MFS transporter n=1 Tax=Roseomonas acroporae TaxID=2937791 RepID=A0A9X2BX73_9PROT|nr:MULTISPECIES: MFS transporter [Roseomonas]MCG7351886.1 MFS transporter [Roseomonas mucosa]MCG7356114.1 MFS transporter [Roseomonas mucosa]MCK8786896.1 MFS transporter [Roseomonas acroporae]MDT8294172.1 MFS transporter [Roseomonas mucosa]UFN51830.1 MFS transporter [Roseomonas sp. OT10]
MKAADLVRRRGVVTTTLGITQTLAWASTYYLPAVFADPVCEALGLSRALFFGIFSGALLLSGLVGPTAGRLIDTYGGRDVLAASNLVFAAGLALLSFAFGPVTLALAWAVIGVGMGFGLYEAAFATVTGLYGREARNAITGITLFAGFASTVGWPASAFMIDALGWRGACLAWAVLHLVVALPLNRFLVAKVPPPPPAAAAVPADAAPGGVPWTMVILAAVFAATTFVSTAIATHLPRIIEALGAAPTAAIFAASLVGPAQVAARVAEFALLRKASPLVTAQLAAGLHPVGAALLAFLGPVVAIPFVLLHGAGNGLLTIARGTLPLALFGPAGYGLRTGLLAAPARLLQGGAPLLFALVLDALGPHAALMLSSTLTALSLVALLALTRRVRDPGADRPRRGV